MTVEPIARRAVLGDEYEIVRLRTQMREAIWPESAGEPDPYADESVERARRWLKDSETARTAAFVIDAPDGDGLAASAIGAIDDRLPSPRNPIGAKGYVYGVCTEERFRRRGYSRLVMKALLDWYEEQGVYFVDLHASRFGEGLYRELGFAEPRDLALTWVSEKQPQ